MGAVLAHVRKERSMDRRDGEYIWSFGDWGSCVVGTCIREDA